MVCTHACVCNGNRIYALHTSTCAGSCTSTGPNIYTNTYAVTYTSDSVDINVYNDACTGTYIDACSTTCIRSPAVCYRGVQQENEEAQGGP